MISLPPAAVGLKLSTEDAGMSFGQIAAYVERFAGRIEILLKIGGPGARNDVAEGLRRGVDLLVAPMIESAYALEDFVSAVAERNGDARRVRLGVNIETVSAVERLETILGAPAAARLSLVVVGRGDLARSMGLSVEDPAVTAAARRVVEAARARGLATSVGGGVTPAGARRAAEEIRPDRVNTRLFVLDPALSRGGDLGEAVAACLEAEVALLEDDVARGFATRAVADRRIAGLRRRLEDR